MGREKKHHYVPVSYLKRFTRTGSDSGDLWVFDGETSRSWKSTPLGSAHARDYNLIESEGVDPFAAEKDIFCTIEGAGVRVFDRIEDLARECVGCGKAGIIVEPGDIEELCLFMAAQAIRVPARRAALDDFESDIARKTVELSAESPEAFEDIKKRHGVDEDFTIDDLREMLTDASVRLRVVGTPTTHLAATLPSLVPVARLLTMRRWSVLLAPPQGPFYVTSDDPVALVPERIEPSFFGVGFGTPGSRVIFPISRTTCLLGDDLQPGHKIRPTMVVLPPDVERVPTLNVAVVGRADRHVYAGEPDFVWLDTDDTVRDSKAYLEKAKALRQVEPEDDEGAKQEEP